MPSRHEYTHPKPEASVTLAEDVGSREGASEVAKKAKKAAKKKGK
jgi:hypothetical protein